LNTPSVLGSLSRRDVLVLALGAAVPAVAWQRSRSGDSHLRARRTPPTKTITAGEYPLGLGSGRDGLLRVPKSYRPDAPAPLAMILHGAGGSAARVARLLGVAESLGIILLAPDSRRATWDVIQSDYGEDVEFVNQALGFTFDRCAIDPRRLAIGGFSDGATYALSLGLDNGDLFTHVLAFSPGFIAARNPRGQPQIFVSHGKHDEILPIASTSRRLVPGLERAGYPVKYREFDGPHAVPPEIAQEGFKWFLQ
jgi:phospholipase/carboxylesterase